jgi:hypothetical protein
MPISIEEKSKCRQVIREDNPAKPAAMLFTILNQSPAKEIAGPTFMSMHRLRPRRS